MCACSPPSYLENLLIDLGKFAIDVQKHQNLLHISQTNFNHIFKILNSYAPEIFECVCAEPEVEVVDVDFEYV